MNIELIPALSDNYVYLLHEPVEGAVAIVDPAEATVVEVALQRRGLRPTHVLNTHHHMDHIGGNQRLKATYDCELIAPAANRREIADIDVAVGDGDHVGVGTVSATVFATPGHTQGHVAYWFPEAKALFCGDTLFAMGCGRLFEGSPEQMWSSLLKLRALPGETRVYCGHEYTLSNARFALTVDPDNLDLQARAADVETLRREGKPTIPSTIELERKTNPFLRADQPAVQSALGMSGADPVKVFAELRTRKDRA